MVSYLTRKSILRILPRYRPSLIAFVLDSLFVLGTAIIVSAAELWKVSTMTSLSPWGATAYFVGGCVIVSGIATKWILASLNQRTKAEVDALENRVREAEKKCGRHVQSEFLVAQVMRAKAERLLARGTNGQSFEAALDPKKQIELLMAVLHRQLSRHLPGDQTLRLGIYRLAADGHMLTVFSGWDGKQASCFSNGHTQFMNVSETPKDECVVVECWRTQDEDPSRRMILVEDFETDERFGYFHKGQSRKLKSMAAYNHLCSYWPKGRFVLTADSTQVGFFSGDVGLECKVLFPALSRRIEMELAALQNN